MLFAHRMRFLRSQAMTEVILCMTCGIDPAIECCTFVGCAWKTCGDCTRAQIMLPAHFLGPVAAADASGDQKSYCRLHCGQLPVDPFRVPLSASLLKAVVSREAQLFHMCQEQLAVVENLSRKIEELKALAKTNGHPVRLREKSKGFFLSRTTSRKEWLAGMYAPPRPLPTDEKATHPQLVVKTHPPSPPLFLLPPHLLQAPSATATVLPFPPPVISVSLLSSAPS